MSCTSAGQTRVRRPAVAVDQAHRTPARAGDHQRQELPRHQRCLLERASPHRADARHGCRHAGPVPPMPELLSYWLPTNAASVLARHINETIAEMVRAGPDRFHGLGMVPLQDMDAAQRELEHAMRQLGLKGVEIATNVNGVALGHPSLDPFFAAAEALDAAIFVHPLRPAGMEPTGGTGQSRAGRGFSLRDGARHRLGDHRRPDEAPSPPAHRLQPWRRRLRAGAATHAATPGRRWRRSRPPWRSRGRSRESSFTTRWSMTRRRCAF